MKLMITAAILSVIASAALTEGNISNPEGNISKPEGNVSRPEENVSNSEGNIAKVAANIAQTKGNAAKGERVFKKCKSCHTIANGDTVFFRGGRTGPNLYGVIGRAAASAEGFRYGKSLITAGEAGLIWDQTRLAEYVTDPKVFLREHLDDSRAKSSMSFHLKKGGADVAAYLAIFTPVPDATVDVDGAVTATD